MSCRSSPRPRRSRGRVRRFRPRSGTRSGQETFRQRLSRHCARIQDRETFSTRRSVRALPHASWGSDMENPYARWAPPAAPVAAPDANPYAQWAPAGQGAEPGIVEDVAKSGGSGLVRGVTGTLGAVSDLGVFLGNAHDRYLTNPILSYFGQA